MALKAEEVYAILKKQIQSGGGTPGPAGVGIQKIEKTGTDGLVDTYTIIFTNGSTTTFTITNGADGSQGPRVQKETQKLRRRWITAPPTPPSSSHRISFTPGAKFHP